MTSDFALSFSLSIPVHRLHPSTTVHGWKRMIGAMHVTSPVSPLSPHLLTHPGTGRRLPRATPIPHSLAPYHSMLPATAVTDELDPRLAVVTLRTSVREPCPSSPTSRLLALLAAHTRTHLSFQLTLPPSWPLLFLLLVSIQLQHRHL
jgi:hypothetical protein